MLKAIFINFPRVALPLCVHHLFVDDVGMIRQFIRLLSYLQYRYQCSNDRLCTCVGNLGYASRLLADAIRLLADVIRLLADAIRPLADHSSPESAG